MSVPTNADVAEWRYLTGRKVVHGLRDGSFHILGYVARCGTSPMWYDPRGWLGTGTQGEYERAAALPRCRRCLRLYAHDRGAPW